MAASLLGRSGCLGRTLGRLTLEGLGDRAENGLAFRGRDILNDLLSIIGIQQRTGIPRALCGTGLGLGVQTTALLPFGTLKTTSAL